MKKCLFFLPFLMFLTLSCKKTPVTVPVKAICTVQNIDEQPIAGKTVRLISGLNLEFNDIATGKIEQTAVTDSKGKAEFNYIWTPSDKETPTYYIVADEDAVYKLVSAMRVEIPQFSGTLPSVTVSNVIKMDKLQPFNVRIKVNSNNVQYYTFELGNVISTFATVVRPFFPKTIITPPSRQVDTLLKMQIYSKSACGYAATVGYTNSNTSGSINGIITQGMNRDSTLLISF